VRAAPDDGRDPGAAPERERAGHDEQDARPRHDDQDEREEDEREEVVGGHHRAA